MSVLTPQQKRRMDDLLRIQENKVCFDCGAPQPRWASSTFGVLLCMRCVGIHRSLGVHISKVQSVNMDSWDDSALRKMECIGNKGGRLLYEFNMPESYRPHSGTTTAMMTKLLKEKYENRAFFNPHIIKLRDEMMQNGPCSAQNVKKPAAQPAPPPPPPEPIPELWGEPVVAPSPAQNPQPPQSSSTIDFLFGGSATAPTTNSSAMPSPYGNAFNHNNTPPAGQNAFGYGAYATPVQQPQAFLQNGYPAAQQPYQSAQPTYPVPQQGFPQGSIPPSNAQQEILSLFSSPPTQAPSTNNNGFAW